MERRGLRIDEGGGHDWRRQPCWRTYWRTERDLEGYLLCNRGLAPWLVLEPTLYPPPASDFHPSFSVSLLLLSVPARKVHAVVPSSGILPPSCSGDST